MWMIYALTMEKWYIRQIKTGKGLKGQWIWGKKVQSATNMLAAHQEISFRANK